MIIEDYKRIDGWLNVRVNPISNESLYDYSTYESGLYHTLSDAEELYKEYLKYKEGESAKNSILGDI